MISQVQLFGDICKLLADSLVQSKWFCLGNVSSIVYCDHVRAIEISLVTKDCLLPFSDISTIEQKWSSESCKKYCLSDDIIKSMSTDVDCFTVKCVPFRKS